ARLSRPVGDSPRAVDDEGLAARLQHALFLQLLEYAPGHLARAADDARQFLPRHLDLGALRVRQRIGFLAQVVEGTDDAPADVEEGQPARLAAGVEQALGELQADRVEDARALGRQRPLEQLVQAVVGNLGQFAGRARA